MKVEIKVPAMGESITEATVGAILKPSGSHVNMDEEVVELETDKVNQVLHAPNSGVLTLSVKVDETVKIGQVIGYVDSEGATPAADQDVPKTAASPVVSELKKGGARLSKDSFIKQESVPIKIPVEKPKPLVAPHQIQEDVKLEPRETRRKMTKIRRLIGERLIEVQRTTAMLTTFNEVDLSLVIELRTKYKDFFAKEYRTKLGYMSFFVKAAVSALTAFPNVNSYISGEDIVHREYYDIGIAVGTERGLIVPVVRGCEQLSFAQIEKAIEAYANQARNGSISVDDLQGGGFTITNGGTYGSLLSTPILNPPQSAILGMHKIEKRAVVVDDQIVIRPMMYLALSYDHRIIDGKEAVSFLVHIKSHLEDPSRLLLEV